MDDEGQRPIAKGHLRDSGNLKMFITKGNLIC